jgi:hypothetical protein
MADIGDVIGLLSDGNKPATPNLLEIATRAAMARDEASEANAKAKLLKEELDEALQAAGLDSIELSDRLIRYKTTNSKQKTLKAFKEILGVDPAKKLWESLPSVPRTSLEIPAPKVPEPEVE